MTDRPKDCFCHTCGRWFHSLGIASHRATHRRKGETCLIDYGGGDLVRHDFRLKGKNSER